MIKKILLLKEKPIKIYAGMIEVKLVNKLSVFLAIINPAEIRKKKFKAILRKLDSRPKPKAAISKISGYFFTGLKAGKLVVNSNNKKSVIKAADLVVEHVFELLGSGPTKLADKINWHQDFVSGKVWPQMPARRIEIFNSNGGFDIKIPWELSRFQHLATLGKAYRITGDEKYAREFTSQIRDWLRENQVGVGVNWAGTMDVAIRAVNWIWAYWFFKDSKFIEDDFWLDLLHSLYNHGRFIRANLEWAPVRNNHYLADLTGLVYLGIFFKNTKAGGQWLKFAVKQLEKEIHGQVFADGVDYEGSLPYQGLVLEMFLSATILLAENGLKFSKRFMARLEKMLEFAAAYTKPDGTIPLYGDADDGRLQILSEETKENFNDHRYLLSIGAVMFERADFKAAAGKFWEEAWWLLGEAGKKKFDSLPEVKKPNDSIAFSEGGFYFMKHQDLYLSVDYGPVGLRGGGGHGHNDALSIEVFAGDKSFITDSGTYVYTADPAARNEFRSTNAHNVVIVDGQEMAEMGEGGRLWSIADQAKAKCLKWETSDNYDLFIGEHYGYRRLKEPVTLRRAIYFSKAEVYWLIKDELFGEGSHQAELMFHFRPMDISLDSKSLIVKTIVAGRNLALIPLEVNNTRAEVVDSWFSPSYGIRHKAKAIKYSRAGRMPITFTTLITPYADSGSDIIALKEAAVKTSHKLDKLIRAT